jgi:hypothetical protein
MLGGQNPDVESAEGVDGMVFPGYPSFVVPNRSSVSNAST